MQSHTSHRGPKSYRTSYVKGQIQRVTKHVLTSHGHCKGEVFVKVKVKVKAKAKGKVKAKVKIKVRFQVKDK